MNDREFMRPDRLVGILSQRDPFRAAASPVLRIRPSSEREWLARRPGDEAMPSQEVAVAPAPSIREIVNLMVEKRGNSLPVSEDGTTVKLLNEMDCLRHLTGPYSRGREDTGVSYST